MNGYRIIASCLWLCLTATISAQSFEEYKRQQQAKFNTYAQKKAEEYRVYRDRVNAEYADYMRRTWTREEAQPAQPMPKRPEPPRPAVRNPMDVPTFAPIPFGKVQDLKLPQVAKPEPVIPIEELEQLVITVPDNDNDNRNGCDNGKPKEEEKPTTETKPEGAKQEGMAFKWCGQTWRVPLEEQHRFRLKSANEADVADAWKQLSGAKYAGVVAACLRARNDHHLPDWGYLRFVEAMAGAFLPSQANEARLLTMFVLVQSGYQVRIARAEGRLYLLVPSSGEIYGYSYMRMGGRKFYVTDKNAKRAQAFHVFERDFPREQPFTWHMQQLPTFGSTRKSRNLQAARYADVRATVSIDKGLIEFLNDYPKCNDWNFYALAGLSDGVKESLYPALHRAVDGKAEAEAADVLLNFVQTAFAYQTDQEQFGTERPLFGDETLYYPYCDCEDRAILFSILVRELLGLDVVLLNYPDHLATAVRLGDDVAGDYLELDGHRYVV
ncbi:MAG: hypothetical protein IJT48_08130, partial [Bacteroidaceae bacterium]|nr:hypothetical protein [Bacteroidaceae bacterium]